MWQLIAYVIGVVVFVYPTYILLVMHERRDGGGRVLDADDFAFCVIFACLAAVMWPVILSGGVLFLASRTMWRTAKRRPIIDEVLSGHPERVS